MHNHTQDNTRHQFLIHGGDKRGTNRLLWVTGGLIPCVFLLIWFLGDLGFWIGVGGSVSALAVCFWWMGSGQAERYEINIDTETNSISAIDRVRGLTMWEDDFQLDWLQISEIQVVLSGESYRNPALVYAEDKVEFIMDTVPTSTRILLGLGDKSEIEAVWCLLTGKSST